MMNLISNSPPFLRLYPAHILLVEDNAIIQEVMKAILTEMGMEVDVANDGAEAVQMAVSKQYDAILMDLQMPVMDGYEAARTIREQESGWETPIIAVTAEAIDEVKERVLKAGMNASLSKSFAPLELFNVLQRAMDDSFKQKEDRRASIHAERLAKLLNEFMIEHADTMKWIQYAISKGDLENALFLARTLKNAALSIGAAELTVAIEKLEHTLINHQNPSIALTIATHKLKVVLSSIEMLEARS
ncbi:response regulator [Paenibacillus sp. OV219]|uniref:response regulator n=1 Tax=Paenibacillus sp. OV219 TaxID=1884377 RepID=UPI0015A6A33C|nr:response regulator [Paenibacillus sp. OV219]